jgi:hypothetical protein
MFFMQTLLKIFRVGTSMGIDIHSADFLRSQTKRGLILGRLLTLGHQSVSMDREYYRSLLASLGVPCQNSIFADDFFRALGAKSVDVMDLSDYEGANILHDLNEPVGNDLLEKFDCVFDGGALEHVFNLPQALKNCLEMVRVGGHFMSITPTAAYCGHGFYQFSPELFYSALSGENGYAMERMLFVNRGQWYSVRKPAEIKARVELFVSEPTLLFVCAKRLECRRIFARWPQQSDYTVAWDEKKPPEKSQSKTLKAHALDFLPLARQLQARWNERRRRQAGHPSNGARFVPVSLD